MYTENVRKGDQELAKPGEVLVLAVAVGAGK